MKCNCNSHGTFLTAKGLREAAQRELSLASIDAMDTRLYLDKVGSVSGSPQSSLPWDDALIEEQYRRFHNGS